MKHLSTLFFVALALPFGSANAGWFKKHPSATNAESFIASSAETVNKQLPVMVDSNTRMDRVVPGPGLLFTYQYTITNLRYSAAAARYIQGEFADELRPKICANEKLHVFFKQGVNISYSYSGTDGVPIGAFLVTAKQCGF